MKAIVFTVVAAAVCAVSIEQATRAAHAAGISSRRTAVAVLDEGARSEHGRAVAGIVSAACPGCTVASVTVLDAAGSGDEATVARGLVSAVVTGARVVNLSMVGASEEPVLRTAIRTAVAHGVVVVAAAGNDGSSAPSYPAADPDVIGVAAATSSGSLFPWSNRGPWVSVAAPGVEASFVGTSAAAPAVAGAVGACLAAAPELSVDDVRRLLARTALPLPGMPFGRLDPGRLVHACASA